MLTVIIKRDAEPTVIQLTQENIMRELASLPGSEMLLEDSWVKGLRKVRTPYVCLLEADCTLSANYLASNIGLMHKTGKEGKTGVGRGGDRGGGGYTKLAMIASCLGVDSFANRIYNYHLTNEVVFDDPQKALKAKAWRVTSNRNKLSSVMYQVQIGFVPGAIIRMASIKEDIDKLPWDKGNLVELSTALSFHFWKTGRRIQVNPNTTYVSTQDYLEDPPYFNHKLPDTVANLFTKESIS